jgi:hypothetical protein
MLKTKQTYLKKISTLLIVVLPIISVGLSGCLEAKKSPFDINSTGGLIAGFISVNSSSSPNSANDINGSTLSSGKEIKSFSFSNPSVPGIISNTSITGEVPFGTNMTNLVANFTTTGKSVKVGSVPQVSGVTENDFTSAVIYTVTAEDETTQNYTVTISRELQANAPVFNVTTGTYYQDQFITITSTTPGASIYFNRGLNPSDPDCNGNGTLYSGPITVDTTGTIIKAISCKSGLAASNISSENYTLRVAATYVYSNNTENRLVIPFKFTATTSSVTTITKCLRNGGTPSCNADGTCGSGVSTELIYNTNASVTVSAIGCKANYLPSLVDTKTFTVSAIRSTDNTYLTIVDPAATTNIQNKIVFICSEGETYNTTTGNCQGTAINFQYCTSNDNSCNGGADGGLANNASPIFTHCNSRTYGADISGLWRVPTLNELTGFFGVFAKNPNGWPITVGLNLWSNQSVLTGFANDVSNTGAYQININQTQKALTRNLRCIHD